MWDISPTTLQMTESFQFSFKEESCSSGVECKKKEKEKDKSTDD